jgi:hypothetical protein
MAWTFVERGLVRDRDADRRALETRALELTARAVAPGSALACLDGIAGETVEAACEKALFASPETVASAMSYVAARLTLLSESADPAAHRQEIDGSLVTLRRSLENDRFGFVAHVLSARDGCTSQNCKALALFEDARQVRTNLNGHVLDRYLEHYATVWAKNPAISTAGVPVAEASPEPARPKLPLNVDFPSAASIPPVSIMNAEPTGPVLPGVAAAAAANPNPPPTPPPAPSRRARRQSAAPQPAPAPPRPAPAQATLQPAPQVAPAPQPGAAVVPPVQLVPFPPSEASAGAATRAQ